MTGRYTEDFVDGAKTSSSPRLDHRKPGRMVVPDARDTSYLLRAALASGEVANMRECPGMATFSELRSPSGIKYMGVYLAQGQLFEDAPNTTASSEKSHSTLRR